MNIKWAILIGVVGTMLVLLITYGMYRYLYNRDKLGKRPQGWLIIGVGQGKRIYCQSVGDYFAMVDKGGVNCHFFQDKKYAKKVLNKLKKKTAGYRLGLEKVEHHV